MTAMSPAGPGRSRNDKAEHMDGAAVTRDLASVITWKDAYLSKIKSYGIELSENLASLIRTWAPCKTTSATRTTKNKNGNGNCYTTKIQQKENKQIRTTHACKQAACAPWSLASSAARWHPYMLCQRKRCWHDRRHHRCQRNWCIVKPHLSIETTAESCHLRGAFWGRTSWRWTRPWKAPWSSNLRMPW